ncbi:hypothetical protein Tcan_08902 [Toxocara canis]|uniref:Uncharacterized protein n=1 Tax=Toxocara canis TaxID=6265 RepID=A0A0B2W244_TOXCA|nr:hypothetical protein Tcan_08902 [Toxocara canis]
MPENDLIAPMRNTLLAALLFVFVSTWINTEATNKGGGFTIHRSTMKPFMDVEKKWNKTLEELKDALSSYEEWKEKKKSEAENAAAAFKEWLSNSEQKYKGTKAKEKEQLYEWLWKHRCGGKDCDKTTTASPQSTSIDEWTSSWKDWLEGMGSHRKGMGSHHKGMGSHNKGMGSHHDGMMEPMESTYESEEEVEKKIEEFLELLREASKWNRKGETNETATPIRLPLFREFASIIVPPGNETTPTVAAEVVYKGWWNDVWFWIIHVVGVLIIIVLIITICAMRMQKKKDYQRLV